MKNDMTTTAEPSAPDLDFSDGDPPALAQQVMARGWRARAPLVAVAGRGGRRLRYTDTGVAVASDDDVCDGVAAVIGGLRALGEPFDGQDVWHFLSSGAALKSLLKVLEARDPVPAETLALGTLVDRLCRDSADVVSEAIFVQDFFAVPRHGLFDLSMRLPQRSASAPAPHATSPGVALQ